MRTPLRLLGLIVALGLILAGCNATTPYAAIVADKRISESALDDELKAIESNAVYRSQLEQQGNTITGEGRGTFDTAFVARVLTLQILFELVHQAVEERDIEISQAELDAAEEDVVQQMGGQQIFKGFPKGYQETLIRRNAEVAALQKALADTPIDEESIRAYYEANKDELFSETCVSHILFSPQAKGERPDLPADADASALIAQANRAKARVEGGAPFEDVARELSKDQTAEAGGSLGCVGPGNFVPEFEQAMEQLAPGEVSDPVRTQFGIHLIKVTDRRVQPLEEVEEEVRQALLSEAQGNLQSWLFETLAEVEIEVNPRYGSFSTEGGSPRVVPPDRPTTTVANPPLGDGGLPGGGPPPEQRGGTPSP